MVGLSGGGGDRFWGESQIEGLTSGWGEGGKGGGATVNKFFTIYIALSRGTA